MWNSFINNVDNFYTNKPTVFYVDKWKNPRKLGFFGGSYPHFNTFSVSQNKSYPHFLWKNKC